MYRRKLNLPNASPPSESFFLWGPRQVGKSTLLKQYFPRTLWIDLLKANELRRYLENPE